MKTNRIRNLRWRIYYADRELARLLDDVCLGTVRAPTKAAAEARAARVLPRRFTEATLWAVPCRADAPTPAAPIRPGLAFTYRPGLPSRIHPPSPAGAGYGATFGAVAA